MFLMADICLYKIRHPAKHSDQAEEKQQPGLSQREAQSSCREFQTGVFFCCFLCVEMLDDVGVVGRSRWRLPRQGC